MTSAELFNRLDLILQELDLQFLINFQIKKCRDDMMLASCNFDLSKQKSYDMFAYTIRKQQFVDVFVICANYLIRRY